MEINSYLLEKLKEEYDKETIDKIISGYKLKRYTTFRVNTLKSNKEEINNVLDKLKINYEYGPIKNSYIIKDKYDLVNLDIYKEGKIYLQSLSSMLPPFVMNPKEDDHILDMAAAPGGKTSQIAALTNNKCSITAVEVNPLRAEKLKYNLEKLSATRVTVLVSDARQLDDFFRFDKILLDAPCSGSGTIDLNIENSNQKFSEKIIETCKKRQISLLNKAIRMLKTGGEIIYSTCSILKEENEEVLSQVLRTNSNIKLVDLSEYKKDYLPLIETKYKESICLYPNEYYEGFFVSKIVKIK